MDVEPAASQTQPPRTSGRTPSGALFLGVLVAVAIAFVVIGGFPSVTHVFVTVLVLPASLVAGFMWAVVPRFRAAVGSLGAVIIAGTFAAVLATPSTQISSSSFPPVPDRVVYVIIGILGVFTFLFALGVGAIIGVLTNRVRASAGPTNAPRQLPPSLSVPASSLSAQRADDEVP